MKRILVIVLLLSSFSTFLLGQNSQRDSIEARQTAQTWFATHKLQKKHANHHTTPTENLKMQSHPTGWFCSNGPQFVLISKYKNTPSVLGYGSATGKQMPKALQALLNTTPSARLHYPLEGTTWKEVAPLLTTQHGPYSPYNDLCPYYTDNEGHTSDQRCVAGCVAIAMEQVLTYYQRTYTLQDTLHGWTTKHYTIPDLLPGYTINSRLILDDYNKEHGTTEQRNEVAKLIYSLGVAAHMNWGLAASGTNTYKIIEPLKKAFGMKHVAYLDSYLYDPVSYWTYLARTLMAGRPIYYTGFTLSTEGHAFVLDGLNKDGLFHVNWGYGGDYDGYFRLDVLALREPWSDRMEEVDNGFFCNQEALVICPDEVTDLLPPDTLQRTSGDVVIDSMWTIDSPTTGCRSRIAMAIRNTTDHPLTTSFALLLNEPTDTALFKQANWFAFTGSTLKAGANDTLIVHTTYPNNGEKIVSATTDGTKVAYQFSTNIGTEGTTDILFDTPQASFPELGSVTLQLHLSNPLSNERAAATFMSELVDNETNINVQKTHRIYLEAAADTTFHTTFTQLIPGRKYTFKLHRIWPTVATINFTLPTTDAINSIQVSNELKGVPSYFGLDGRSYGTTRPTQPGIYLMHKNESTQKIIIH